MMRKKLYSFVLMAVGLLISGNAVAQNVAKIGDTEYATLSALTTAFESLPNGVETEVTILSDIEFTSTSYDGWGTNMPIPAGKNIKLNLGEYFLKNKSTGWSSHAAVVVNGTLTVEATTGGIVANNNPAFCVGDGAKLTVNGGVYSEDGTNARYALFVDDSNGGSSSFSNAASITINGGSFTGQTIYRMGTIMHIGKNVNIAINGGNFSTISKGTTQQGNQWGLIVVTSSSPECNLTITDGKFDLNYGGTSTTPNSYTFACVDYRSKKGTLAISGGEFTNLYQCADGSQTCCALYVYDQTERVEITGGTFKSHGYAARIKAYNAGVDKATIQNANFISETGCALLFCSFSNNETYNINGGTYQGKYGIAVFGNTKATVNINDCSINATTCGIQCQGLSEVNILGGSIESQKIGVQYAQGSYSSADGIINIGGSASIKAGTYGVYNDKGTINITGGRIWGNTYSAFNVKYNECANLQGTVEIIGGVFNNRPVPEDYTIRTETPASAPIRKAGIVPIGDPIPEPPMPPTPPCDETAQAGNATILGVGLDVIDNPDQTTYDLGYVYAVGRKETIGIQPADGSSTIDWATNTTWTDGENNVVPTISDDVTIPVGKEIVVGESGHTDAVAKTVTILGTSDTNQGNLRVKTGSSLTVGELLTVGEPANQYGQAVIEAGGRLIVGNASDQMVPNIILEDDGINGTGAMLFNPETTEMGNVQATIELHTNAHKISEGNYFWNYIGIPLKTDNFTAANWEKIPVTADQATSSYLQTWDFTEGWVNKGLEAFKPFQGVAITNDSKDGVIYRFKGTMVGNADKNMVFKPRGYNFFANSYTAPIDIKTLLTELKDNGVVDAVVYMFDTENDRFAEVSLGAFSGFHAPYFRVIPSMNGFFILNQQTQTSNQTMDYGDAVYNCALGNRPVYAPQREAIDFSRVHINVEANGSKDGLYLIENEEFTSEFENGYDVIKYMTPGQSNIYVQTAQGSQSELFNSNIEGTMIGFEAANNQTIYTLSFDELQGETFVLTDMETGVSTEMNEDNTYTFTAQAGQRNDSRFMITRGKKTPTDMDNVECNVKARGIYSIMGQYLGAETEWKNLPAGVYLVNGIKVVK